MIIKYYIIINILLCISFNSYAQDINTIIKTKAEFSWFTYLTENVSNNKDLIPWSQEFELKEDLFDQIGGMYYELYDGKFRHIDEIKSSLVKKYIPQTAEVVFKKTKIGKRIDTISKKVVSYFRVEYIKKDDYKDAKLYLPGDIVKDDEVEIEGIYGITFSAHISTNDDYIFELNSFYTDSTFIASYDLIKAEFVFSFMNTRLEKLFNGKTKIEFISNKKETNGTLTIFFPF